MASDVRAEHKTCLKMWVYISKFVK
jgi:hypothetical protein